MTYYICLINVSHYCYYLNNRTQSASVFSLPDKHATCMALHHIDHYAQSRPFLFCLVSSPIFWKQEEFFPKERRWYLETYLLINFVTGCPVTVSKSLSLGKGTNWKKEDWWRLAWMAMWNYGWRLGQLKSGRSKLHLIVDSKLFLISHTLCVCVTAAWESVWVK